MWSSVADTGLLSDDCRGSTKWASGFVDVSFLNDDLVSN
jgi:hypothetical protein